MTEKAVNEKQRKRSEYTGMTNKGTASEVTSNNAIAGIRKKTTVVIPNLNGIKYLGNCLRSLSACEEESVPVIVVDNGSTDGSAALVEREFPAVTLIRFPENRGFCAAVNAGISAACTPFVILLNNDTTVESQFVTRLTAAVMESDRYFSAGAKMLCMDNPEIIDDAGDYYCALGWAFARGKGRSRTRYQKPCDVFAACGGAAIYRTDVLRELGLFDEAHFAYLEDIDIGYRARLHGYRNRYAPEAVVYHAGSASSGSRYNEFKIRLSSRNSVYLIGKNMPALQIAVNLPFLLLGFLVKYLFFLRKGFGRIYVKGLWKGLKLCLSEEGKARRIPFCRHFFPACLRIQGELLYNLFVRRLFC
ncbi:glycosyltransferase family 2 protein [Lachnospiraceae bacterium JLR.KK008]